MELNTKGLTMDNNEKYIDSEKLGANEFELEDGRRYTVQNIVGETIGRRTFIIHHGMGDVPSETIPEQDLILEFTPKYYELYVKSNELKPCACCNTDVELESWEVEHDHYDEYFYQIKCPNCGLMMKDSTTSNPYDNDIIKNLIGQWNTRACDCDRLKKINSLNENIILKYKELEQLSADVIKKNEELERALEYATRICISSIRCAYPPQYQAKHIAEFEQKLAEIQSIKGE